MTPVVIKPSSWLTTGIRVKKINNLNLFKFTEELGDRMKVVELVEAHLAYDWSPEEIQHQHPYLTRSQIYSALAYYWDYKEELDADIERRFQYAEKLRLEAGESPLVKKLRAKGLIN